MLEADVLNGTLPGAGLEAVQGSAVTQQVQAQKQESAGSPTGHEEQESTARLMEVGRSGRGPLVLHRRDTGVLGRRLCLTSWETDYRLAGLKLADIGKGVGWGTGVFIATSCFTSRRAASLQNPSIPHITQGHQLNQKVCLPGVCLLHTGSNLENTERKK